ncbi:MAG: exonuclease SbcCD subunit D C-terminal domain-containing protein [Tannerellaceae bacterium]|nr:exonuclease SbcCD subunit D C-terminal domain-containing protein [Tannerellaceae bacterium]
MGLKIIHTADWHLGQTFFGYDREAEHEAFLVWLAGILKEVEADVLLLSGDVFDVANPSAQSQRRFFSFLKEIHTANPHLQIVVTAGNHDSPIRLEAPLPLLEVLNTTITGVIRRTGEGTIDFDSMIIPLYDRTHTRRALCLALPFLRQGDYPPAGTQGETYATGVARMYQQLVAYAQTKRQPGEALIAMGHLHATGAELSDNDPSERVIMGGLESVAASSFSSDLAYVALGHIHKAQRVGGRENIRYSGSPLPMSFSETNYKHQVVFVHIEQEAAISIEPILVPQMVELKIVPPKPLPAAEVLKALEALPVADKTSGCLHPFVEVRVLLTEPEPALRHKVEEALEGKAARLTSVLPFYPDREETEMVRPATCRELQQMDPVDMLRHAFSSKYGGDLPEELQKLFTEVISEVNV